jgi:hypothetical protein
MRLQKECPKEANDCLFSQNVWMFFSSKMLVVVKRDSQIKESLIFIFYFFLKKTHTHYS